ncbi:hypothetical protein MACH09_00290 [Vibrio sp. MACH09]|nr:hypothetical protein MACH09_00290 [Vibrio sp. MACH09]
MQIIRLAINNVIYCRAVTNYCGLGHKCLFTCMFSLYIRIDFTTKGVDENQNYDAVTDMKENCTVCSQLSCLVFFRNRYPVLSREHLNLEEVKSKEPTYNLQVGSLFDTPNWVIFL